MYIFFTTRTFYNISIKIKNINPLKKVFYLQIIIQTLLICSTFEGVFIGSIVPFIEGVTPRSHSTTTVKEFSNSRVIYILTFRKYTTNKNELNVIHQR